MFLPFLCYNSGSAILLNREKNNQRREYIMTDYEKVQGLQEEKSAEDKLKVSQVEKAQKEQVVIKRVIAGKNDIFEKHYTFEELGGLELDIKIKFPNMIEQARIQAQAERYFEGLGSLMPQRVVEAYRMLATLRICGKDVPKLLSEDEQIYNIFIFNVIGDDFRIWMDSFRY